MWENDAYTSVTKLPSAYIDDYKYLLEVIGRWTAD